MHKSRTNGDSQREERDKSRRGDNNHRHRDRSPADRRHRDTEHRRNGDEVTKYVVFSQTSNSFLRKLLVRIDFSLAII